VFQAHMLACEKENMLRVLLNAQMGKLEIKIDV